MDDFNEESQDFSVHDVDESPHKEPTKLQASPDSGAMAGGNSTVNMASVVPNAKRKAILEKTNTATVAPRSRQASPPFVKNTAGHKSPSQRAPASN